MKPLNFFILIVILFFSTSSLVHAQKEIDLSEHGADLMKAPFAARYHFYNRYHKDWIYSIYEERRDFLTDWHQQLMDKAISEEAQAKQDKIDQRERARLKKEEIKKEKARIKAYQEQEKAAHKEFTQRGKNFDVKVESAQRELREMQRSSSR